MVAEVLVVDDNRAAAESYAALIMARAQLLAVSTSEPGAAVKLMRENPIKAAVLDQRMPLKSGNSIVPRFETGSMFARNNADRRLILTKLRRAECGFSDYVHKSRVAELPGKVLVQILQYHVNAIKRTGLKTKS